jgi:SAM-dependent methyltransferase
MVNYFGDGMDARRYARARPNIHPTAVEKFRRFAQIDGLLSLALDVGCGTGQSTVALTHVAERVIGIDPSADMLEHAARHPNVEYRQSAAEHTPFRDSQFDLITAAQVFHWFDHDAFLAESYRLLRVPGWLLVYTSWFTGEMKGEPAFSDWFKGEYLRRYPTPPRDRTPITKERARKHGLVFRGEDEFSNEVGMTIHRFTDYQLSTTNIIAAVKRGTGSFDDAARWIRASLEPFFSNGRERIFLFTGKIWYLTKTAV